MGFKKTRTTGFRPVGNLVVLLASNNKLLCLGNNDTAIKTLLINSHQLFGQDKKMKCNKKYVAVERSQASHETPRYGELETVLLNSAFDMVNT